MCIPENTLNVIITSIVSSLSNCLLIGNSAEQSVYHMCLTEFGALHIVVQYGRAIAFCDGPIIICESYISLRSAVLFMINISKMFCTRKVVFFFRWPYHSAIENFRKVSTILWRSYQKDTIVYFQHFFHS